MKQHASGYIALASTSLIGHSIATILLVIVLAKKRFSDSNQVTIQKGFFITLATFCLAISEILAAIVRLINYCVPDHIAKLHQFTLPIEIVATLISYFVYLLYISIPVSIVIALVIRVGSQNPDFERAKKATIASYLGGLATSAILRLGAEIVLIGFYIETRLGPSATTVLVELERTVKIFDTLSVLVSISFLTLGLLGVVPDISARLTTQSSSPINETTSRESSEVNRLYFLLFTVSALVLTPLTLSLFSIWVENSNFEFALKTIANTFSFLICLIVSIVVGLFNPSLQSQYNQL